LPREARSVEVRRFDFQLIGLDNAPVAGVRSMRKLIAALSVASVFALPLLPSEHAHEERTAGRHSEVVHRHFHSHHAVESHTTVGDHEDDDVTWLSSPFVVPAKRSPVHKAPASITPVVISAAPQPSSWLAPTTNASGHDPPGSPFVGLRAPPALPV
jgi:hypothetical protein